MKDDGSSVVGLAVLRRAPTNMEWMVLVMVHAVLGVLTTMVWLALAMKPLATWVLEDGCPVTSRANSAVRTSNIINFMMRVHTSTLESGGWMGRWAGGGGG